MDDRLKQEEARRAELLAGLARGLETGAQPPKAHLIHGEAREVILALARDLGIDLVVLGTVCWTGLPGLLMGNPALGPHGQAGGFCAARRGACVIPDPLTANEPMRHSTRAARGRGLARPPRLGSAGALPRGLQAAAPCVLLAQTVEVQPDVGGFRRCVGERDRPVERDAGLLGAPELTEQCALDAEVVEIA